jgi:(2Fe-2S) ferredoxin
LISEHRATDAVVLYGRASFDRTQRLAAVAARLVPGRRVALAFADLTGPSLPDVLDGLAEEGCRAATVVACMVPADPTLSTWLAGALSRWSADRGHPLAVRLAPPIEAALDLAAAVEEVLTRPSAAALETPPSLGKPGWSKIPEHGRQLFFCTGARCLHRAAEPLWQHLRARMKANRALGAGPRRVMCARSSCLYPCNLGPLMTVHPDGVWYGRLDRAALDRVVEEHLLGGVPVAEHVVHVTAGSPGPNPR